MLDVIFYMVLARHLSWYQIPVLPPTVAPKLAIHYVNFTTWEALSAPSHLTTINWKSDGSGCKTFHLTLAASNQILSDVIAACSGCQGTISTAEDLSIYAV